METQHQILALLLEYGGKNYLKGKICMEVSLWAALSNLAQKSD
jgi:hypothetical protein